MSSYKLRFRWGIESFNFIVANWGLGTKKRRVPQSKNTKAYVDWSIPLGNIVRFGILKLSILLQKFPNPIPFELKNRVPTFHDSRRQIFHQIYYFYIALY
jgi:hypothetical protein